MGCSITLIDFIPTDFKRFLTVLADIHLLGDHCPFRTGLVVNGIRLTKRYSALSSRCYITCGISKLAKSFTVLVFTHAADYCIMITHLTSNSFEGNSCIQQADKPIICLLCASNICLRTFVHRERIHY